MKFINSQIYTKQEYFLDSDDPQFSSQLPNEIKFNNIGHIKLDRRMLSTRVTGPSMLHADVASPLDGILALNMKYFVDESIGQVQRSERPAMNRTFVSVYRMVDGYASWTRFLVCSRSVAVVFLSKSWRREEEGTNYQQMLGFAIRN